MATHSPTTHKMIWNLTFSKITKMRRLLTRKYGTEVSSEKILTKNTTTTDGFSILEKINISSKWSSLSKPVKYGIIGYTTAVLAAFVSETYNDGKNSLLKQRNSDVYKSVTFNGKKSLDWQAVKDGCRHNAWRKFWESTIFPVKIISNVTPGLVLFFNPTPPITNISNDAKNK